MTQVEDNGNKSNSRSINLKKIVGKFFVGGSIFFLVKGIIWLVIFFAATFGITDLIK